MPRRLIEKPVSTPNARSALAPGVYWREVNNGVHLGYRKGKRVGQWLVRWYDGAKYRQQGLAAADDGAPADGTAVFNFEHAKRAASEYVDKVRRDEKAAAEGTAPTVRSAIFTYLKRRERKEAARPGARGSGRDAYLRLTKHVLSSSLADTELHELSVQKLKRWGNGLPDTLASATITRLKNDLRAALNAAATEHHARLPAEIFVTIKLGLKSRDDEESSVVSRVDQALFDADVRRIIAAASEIDQEYGWEGDLHRLVLVLAATGARFSQVRRNVVADVQGSRIMVPTSRKGRGTKKRSHVSTPVGADVIAALRPVCAGRNGSATLLERWRHKQVAGRNGGLPGWEREKRGPWENSSELTRPWKLIVEKAGLSANVVPYALRHTSIVRMLRAGLPIRLVAEAHDTSSNIIESHYAASVTSAMEDLVAATIIPLVGNDQNKVVKLRG